MQRGAWLAALVPLACTRAEPAPAPAPLASAAPAQVGQPAPRYGVVMQEVARRFELLGHAIDAERWAFALYQVEELDEVFGRELPRARPPEGCAVALAPLARTFAKGDLHDLQIALAGKAQDRARTAFATAARGCNGCHASAGFEFIEISERTRDAVPRLVPRAAPSAPAAAVPSGK